MTRGTVEFAGNKVNVWIDIQDGEIRASSNRPKESVKFRAFADKYKAEVLPQMKPASQIVIKSTLGNLCEHFGNLSLSAIGTEEIQKYITGLAVAPKTIKNRIGIMQMTWNRARAWGYVKSNPFEFLSMPRQPLSEARRLSVEDVRAIIRKTDEPFKTMLMILAETGLRGGELVAIRRSDITNGVINIARSAFRKQIQTPKTGNAIRRICISGQLARHLSSLAGNERRYQIPARSRDLIEAPANSFLFPYKEGCWDNGEITRRLGIGLHQLRHANASLMASLGVPEHIRRERLGHSSGDITARYTHSSLEDHKKWAEIIGQALGVCTENGLSMAMGAD